MIYSYDLSRTGSSAFKHTVWFLTGLYALSGCVGSKQLVHFQDLNGQTNASLLKPFVPTSQPGDLLAIQMGSLNPGASVFVNPYATQVATTNANVSSSTTPLPATLGYSDVFHLHPNDVIYVEPVSSHVAAADRSYQTVLISLNALSPVAIVLTNAVFGR